MKNKVVILQAQSTLETVETGASSSEEVPVEIVQHKAPELQSADNLAEQEPQQEIVMQGQQDMVEEELSSRPGHQRGKPDHKKR